MMGFPCEERSSGLISCLGNIAFGTASTEPESGVNTRAFISPLSHSAPTDAFSLGSQPPEEASQNQRVATALRARAVLALPLATPPYSQSPGGGIGGAPANGWGYPGLAAFAKNAGSRFLGAQNAAR